LYITSQRKSQIVAALLVLVVLAELGPCTVAQGEKLGLLRIEKVECPVQVPLSYTFSVKLKVEYAFREYYEIQAAIYEGTAGNFDFRLWEGEPERLLEVGERTYNVKLMSPSSEGQWLLTGYVFYRNDSGAFYFRDQERGPGFVEMSIKVANNVRLTVHAPYGNVPVQVDGSSYSADTTGILVHEVRVLAEHTIAAPVNVSVAEGWRALFHSWNGTDHANPKTILVTTDLVLTIEFRDEFYLDIVSTVAGVTGAGWYPSGVVANISAPSLVQSQDWAGALGAQWRFEGWSGDVDSRAPNESIVMDRPHRVIANWTADYERVSYLIVAAAAAVVVIVLAAFLRRGRPKRGAVETVVSVTRTFCIFCGAEIDPDARFCSKCGKSQVSSD
jgi:hypothetical protein